MFVARPFHSSDVDGQVNVAFQCSECKEIANLQINIYPLTTFCIYIFPISESTSLNSTQFKYIKKGCYLNQTFTMTLG